MKRLLLLAALTLAATPGVAQIQAVPVLASSGTSTASGAGTTNITHVANNANAKSVVVRINGVQADSMPITASVANVWRFDCQLTFRTAGPGAGNQPYYCHGEQGPGTATSVINNPASAVVISLDPTLSIPVAVVAAIQTSAADIVLDGYIMKLVQ